MCEQPIFIYIRLLFSKSLLKVIKYIFFVKRKWMFPSIIIIIYEKLNRSSYGGSILSIVADFSRIAKYFQTVPSYIILWYVPI